MDATVQLNARMSRSLKEAGDEALALIGLSPTQAIRALWEKAARRGEDLEEVASLLCERGEPQARDASRPDEALLASWTLVEDILASHGMYYAPSGDEPNDKEMLEQARYEHLVERGLA